MGSHGFPITPKQNKPTQSDPKHDKNITDQPQSSTLLASLLSTWVCVVVSAFVGLELCVCGSVGVCHCVGAKWLRVFACMSADSTGCSSVEVCRW